LRRKIGFGSPMTDDVRNDAYKKSKRQGTLLKKSKQQLLVMESLETQAHQPSRSGDLPASTERRGDGTVVFSTLGIRS